MPVLCPMSAKSNIFPVLLFFIPLREMTCHHFLRNKPEKRPLTKRHSAFKDHTSLYSGLRSSELAQPYPSLCSVITLAQILFELPYFLSSAKRHLLNSVSLRHGMRGREVGAATSSAAARSAGQQSLPHRGRNSHSISPIQIILYFANKCLPTMNETQP